MSKLLSHSTLNELSSQTTLNEMVKNAKDYSQFLLNFDEFDKSKTTSTLDFWKMPPGVRGSSFGSSRRLNLESGCSP